MGTATQATVYQEARTLLFGMLPNPTLVLNNMSNILHLIRNLHPEVLATATVFIPSEGEYSNLAAVFLASQYQLGEL